MKTENLKFDTHEEDGVTVYTTFIDNTTSAGILRCTNELSLSFTIDENGNAIRKKEMQTFVDTLCLNKEILDIETTSFTDYDVKSGETYYYYYKVLSTDLKEYDVSNVVAATPLTRPVFLRKLRSSTVKYWHACGTASSTMAAASFTSVPAFERAAAFTARSPFPKPHPWESTM